MYTSNDYVQPVASHLHHPERLIVQNSRDEWFLWFGDGSEMESIPESLAKWMLSLGQMRALQSPMLWFDPSTLPLSTVTI